MDYFEFISVKLRSLREKRGYSLEKLALLASKSGIHITKDLIHNIEKRRVNSFDPNILGAIAEVFDQTLAEFVSLPDDEYLTINSGQLAKLLVAFKDKSEQNIDLVVDTVTNLLNKLETEKSSKLEILDNIPDENDQNGYIPVYDIGIAAGMFNGETVSDEPAGWVRYDLRGFSGDFFIAKISGRSMEPLIPDNSYCLFKKYSGGSRQGRILLVRSSGLTDPENGGDFVIKRYIRKTVINDTENRAHVEIHLISENRDFPPIVLKNINDEDISTPCEFVKVIG